MPARSVRQAHESVGDLAGSHVVRCDRRAGKLHAEMLQDAMDQVDVMHQSRQVGVTKRPHRVRMDRPHRGLDLLTLGDCDRVEHLAWDVTARNKLTSGHKRLARQRRVVCHHVDHPHVRAARRQVLKQRRITRVEALHVSHLHDQAGLVSTPTNRVCVHRVDTQRLLDQNVYAGVEFPERDLGMGGVRRTNHDRVPTSASSMLRQSPYGRADG
jgi:hypothetical protein